LQLILNNAFKPAAEIPREFNIRDLLQNRLIRVLLAYTMHAASAINDLLVHL
jgi:hypothetical protein